MNIYWNTDAALVFAVSVIVFLVVAAIQYRYLRPAVKQFVGRLPGSSNDLGQSWEQLEAEMSLSLARVQAVSAVLSTFPALYFVLRPNWNVSGWLVFVVYSVVVATIFLVPNAWVRRPRWIVRVWRRLHLPDVSILGISTFFLLIAITIGILLFLPLEIQVEANS